MAIPILGALGGFLKTLGGGIGKKAAASVKGIGQSFKTIKDTGISSMLFDMTRAMDPLIDMLKPITQIAGIFGGFLKAAIAPAMSQLYATFFSPKNIENIQRIAMLIGSALVPVIESLNMIFQILINSGVIDSVIEAIAQITVILALLFSDVLQALVDSGILELLVEGFAFLFDVLNTGLRLLIESGMVEGVLFVLTEIFKAVVWFFTNLDVVWNALVEGWDWFVNALKITVNIFIMVANVIIDVINFLGDIISFGFMPDIPHIPLLETGGMITSSGVAVVHAGEQVLNVETVSAIQDLITEMKGSRGEVQNKNYNTSINAIVLDNENADMLARSLYRQQLLFD